MTDVVIAAAVGAILGLAVGMFLMFIFLLHYNKRLIQIDQFNRDISLGDLKDDADS